MDMNTIIILMILVLFFASALLSNSNKKVSLYSYLMRKGCKCCHGKLGLGDLTLKYLEVECDVCSKRYQLDTKNEKAWEVDDDS